MNEKITLNNICGYKEEKAAVANIITLLNDYDKYSKLGVNIPRGLIFQGSPGTGKTLFSRAIANECNYEFFEAFSKDDGENTLDTLKKVFRKAEDYSKKNNSPALIYIDEIDKLVFTNAYGELVDVNAREATRYLLQKLDETTFKNKILVIASTNNYDRIPHALLRSGRFDKKFIIELPDTESRKEILEFYINNHPLFKNIDIKTLALKTSGMSGADLKTLINNTLIEYIAKKDTIDLDDFIKIIKEMSFETIGKKWKNKTNTLEVLAHEVGHLLVDHFIDNKDVWGDISAIRYGSVEGHTTPGESIYPDEECDDESLEETLKNSNDIYRECIVLLGGAAGEDVYLKRKSIGTLSDIRGLRSNLRVLFASLGFGTKYSDVYCDWSASNEVLHNIWKKHKKLVDKFYKTALKIIKHNKELGLYLIEETHKAGDALGGKVIEEKVNYFNEHKKEMIKKYKKLSIKDLY